MTQSLYDSLPVVLHHVGIEELVVGCPAADGLLVVFSRGNIPGMFLNLHALKQLRAGKNPI
jgi:hypothetical protein